MLTFSVIIPVFNDSKRIRIALDALSRQDYPAESFEVIIADNGSTDGTMQAIEQFRESNRLSIRIVSETGIQSSYAARNAGAACAGNDVLAFTDSDCIPDALWLKTAAEQLTAQNATYGGGAIVFTFEKDTPNIYEYFDSSRKLNQRAYVENERFAATANCFIRRSVFEKHGGFRSDIVSGGDYEFGRRITMAGERIIYIPGAIVHHPARSTFGEIIRKTQRVAMGKKQLHSLGLLDTTPISWRSFVPALKCPASNDVSGRKVCLRNKILLFLLFNICRYINLWIRVR